jgi:hypothetical protein
LTDAEFEAACARSRMLTLGELLQWVKQRCNEMRAEILDPARRELRAGGLGEAETEHALAGMAALLAALAVAALASAILMLLYG